MSEESWPKPDALVSSMLGNVICFRATNYSFQKGEKLYRVESVYKIIDQEITKLAESVPSDALDKDAEAYDHGYECGRTQGRREALAESAPSEKLAGAEAWHQTEIELARLDGEMSGINLTKSKDQTDEQKARLNVLRKRCGEVGQARYALASMQAEAPHD